MRTNSKLSELRNNLGISSESLCQDFGLTDELLEKYESGEISTPRHIVNSLELVANFSELNSSDKEHEAASLGHQKLTGSEFTSFLEEFDRVGRETEIVTKNNIRYFINDFWTAKQRQSNRIHEISYRACFKAELPEFFIDKLTSKGDVVLDPFMGRGTTLIQSSIMGRIPYGNDINPLSKMLVEPRLCPPKLNEIEHRLAEIGSSFDDTSDINCHKELLAFFHIVTLRHILHLREWFVQRTATGQLDGIDKWIRMVALNRLTGHSKGFFSVYSLPPNQATSIKSQLKINEKRQQSPEERDVYEIILKKSKSLLSQHDLGHESDEFKLSTGTAANMPSISDASVSLIVTSPPFLDVVDYAKDNWMRAWFGGFSIEDIDIAIHKKPEDWTAFVRACFGEFSRILKPGGLAAFEVGEVRNATVLLEELVVKAIEGLPFKLHGVMVHDQKFFKTSNSWGVSNNKKGTNTNRIVIVERLFEK